MRTTKDLLEAALDGLQTNGDIGKYLSDDDIDELGWVEPRVMAAYQRIQEVSRDFELIVKGAIRERNG